MYVGIPLVKLAQSFRTPSHSPTVLSLTYREAKIPLKNKIPYMHSFAHTKNFIVLVEFPYYYNMIKTVLSTDVMPAMEWQPEKA
jgi:carotenoid cleavage dioxygenase-like enzyme